MKRNIAFLVVLAVCLCSCCISIGSEVLQKSNDSSRDKIMQKLKNIVIPRLDFEDVTIPTAFKYLKTQSKELDTEGIGINIFLRLAPENVEEKAVLNLILNNKTLGECLFFICAAAKLELRIDNNVVVVSTPEAPSYDITKDERYASDGKFKQANTPTNIKLENIIFPSVELSNAEIFAIIRYLHQGSKRYSSANQGISIVSKFSTATAAALPRLTISFTNISMSDLLQYLCENSCLEYVVCKETIILTVDWVRLVKWYRKAAEQGDPDAQYNLGMCYAKGNGVNKDIPEAIKWYRQAAKKGNEKAQYAIKQLE